MEIKDIISNVNVFGIENSIKGSKYPMSTNLKEVTDEVTKTVVKLATSKQGEGHDNFMNGIIVQFDLTFTNKAWVEAERYHFLDFISSQSTMHRITKFDLDKAFIEYTDQRIIDILKEKVQEYKDLVEKNASTNEINRKYLEVLYSNPAGFKITAKMTTNYRQLKTIYNQRRTHRLPEWKVFCQWVETLPHAEFIIGEK